MENNDYKKDHLVMVNDQIIKRGIFEKRLINTLIKVPRHHFVPDNLKHLAYSDRPLPIGFGQTISQPYIVALMISELQLLSNHHVLEIGTGCGYQTAILANLVEMVTSIEIIPELASRATHALKNLGINNVDVKIGDGSLGWEQNAPYDAILVSAAAKEVPAPLLEQLIEGGKLIMPVGIRDYQLLEIWTLNPSGFQKATGIPVTFVPLTGKYRSEY